MKYRPTAAAAGGSPFYPHPRLAFYGQSFTLNGMDPKEKQAYMRFYMRRWRRNNRDKARAYNREWMRNHRAKTRPDLSTGQA